MKVLCLTFMRVVSTLSNPVPENIETLILHRIAEQFAQGAPATTDEKPLLRFDDPSCEKKGSYSYTNSSIILNAEHDAWSGTLELEFNFLLDGRKISFERISPLHRLFRTQERYEPNRGESLLSRDTLITTGIAVGIAVTIASILLRSTRDHKNPTASAPAANSKIQIQQSSRY